jgi:hypothetical protein
LRIETRWGDIGKHSEGLDKIAAGNPSSFWQREDEEMIIRGEVSPWLSANHFSTAARIG